MDETWGKVISDIPKEDFSSISL